VGLFIGIGMDLFIGICMGRGEVGGGLVGVGVDF